jgi:hypothetical protein
MYMHTHIPTHTLINMIIIVHTPTHTLIIIIIHTLIIFIIHTLIIMIISIINAICQLPA